ncbi:MAG: hypothetical protein LBG84_11465 [Treponema sp.]|jgi:hypothetical protein|nr:hypothetical protein [Treponema sp.]
MADSELVRVIDYILNRCDEVAIEAVAAAVVRRRRELALFGGAVKLPDPRRMAGELSGQINAAASMEGLRETVRDMAVRIIRREAPELKDEQIAELLAAWVPGSRNPAGGGETPPGLSPEPSGGDRPAGKGPPADLLAEMIDHFTRFSTGRMTKVEDDRLRNEMGDWPDRYWNAFPGVIKLIIKDYLNGETDEKAYRSHIAAALSAAT